MPRFIPENWSVCNGFHSSAIVEFPVIDRHELALVTIQPALSISILVTVTCQAAYRFPRVLKWDTACGTTIGSNSIYCQSFETTDELIMEGQRGAHEGS